MKPENIILLGFVNKAVEYLDKHMEDEPDNAVAQLRNIDLNSLKDVLDKNLDASLGMMTTTMNSLMKAGSDSFDSFIESHGDREALSAEISHLFDLDQSGDVSEDDIANLMAYYNLDEPEKDQPFENETFEPEPEPVEQPQLELEPVPEPEPQPEPEPKPEPEPEPEPEPQPEPEPEVAGEDEQRVFVAVLRQRLADAS